MTLQIRTATAADAAHLLAIYRPFVETTAVSFETVTPSLDEFTRRVVSAAERWSFLFAQIDGKSVGYAYGSTHRAREAYRFSVETSAYVHPGYQRQGIARRLYLQLLEQLHERGYANAYAGITLPNDASTGFHQKLGFTPIGVFPRVGYKFGNWHDVAWMHCRIRDKLLVSES